MSQQSVRRSTRIAGQETPREAPRRQRGLPGVDSAKSTAYGSRQRATLPQLGNQLQGGETSVSAALETATGGASGEEEGEQTAPPARSFVREAGATASRQGSIPQAAEPERPRPKKKAKNPEEASFLVRWHAWIAFVCFLVAAAATGFSLPYVFAESRVVQIFHREAPAIIQQQVPGIISRSSELLKQAVVEEVRGMLPSEPTEGRSSDDRQIEGRYEINWISALMGARVDPHLSSDRMWGDEPWLDQTYSSYYLPEIQNPPITALMSWEEAEDAWCAAPAMDPKDLDPLNSKAQLTVIMKRQIYPTSFTIEHIPQSATLDINSAPQWVELWVFVPDMALRDELTDKVNSVMGTRRPIGYDENGDPKPDPSAFEGRNPEPTGLTESQLREYNLGNHWRAPSDFVRVGKFRFDIENPNFFQTFELPVPLEDWIKTNKVLIRVTENYGREWTCMYRFKLRGHLAEEVTVLQTPEERERLVKEEKKKAARWFPHSWYGD